MNTSALGTQPRAFVERRVAHIEMYFNRWMEHARESAKGEQRDFWQGYCRGLLRGFLGPCEIFDEEHHRMLQRGALDETARGYVEAFHAIERLRGTDSEPDAPGVDERGHP